MKWLNELALRQRVVLVIALGVVLLAVGDWLTSASAGGWFGYVPLSRATYPSSFEPAKTALVRTALAIVWAGVSVWLLRDSGGPATGT